MIAVCHTFKTGSYSTSDRQHDMHSDRLEAHDDVHWQAVYGVPATCVCIHVSNVTITGWAWFARLANCEHGMELARTLYNFPMILSAENLASRELDELSGMTYLTYFMKLDSPGYKATLKFVQQQIPAKNVTDFKVSVSAHFN